MSCELVVDCHVASLLAMTGCGGLASPECLVSPLEVPPQGSGNRCLRLGSLPDFHRDKIGREIGVCC